MKLHKETQKYHRIEAFILTAIFFILSVAFFIKTASHPEEYSTLMLLAGGGAIILSLAVFYYLTAQRVDLSVSESSIKYKYRVYPFLSEKRKIKWKDVEEARIVETSLGSSLSGFDVNFDMMEEKHSLNGTNGLALHLKNGSHVFLGSQNLSSLRSAISALEQNKAVG